VRTQATGRFHAVHNPAKSFIRPEFKDEHAKQIKAKGWDT
jgi:hypothetical protein